MELTDIKGIGAKRAESFREMQILSPRDLLFFYPSSYIDDSDVKTVAALQDGEKTTLKLVICSSPSVFYRGKLSMVSVSAKDDTGRIKLKWFNQPYIKNRLCKGMEVFAFGSVNLQNGAALINPRISDKLMGIVPVYPQIAGVPNALLRSAISEVLDTFDEDDPVPTELIRKYGLMAQGEALREIHIPSEMSRLQKARERAAFVNSMLYFIAAGRFDTDRLAKKGIAYNVDGLMARFISKLSFVPTNSQLEAMRSIDSHMSADKPMNILLQGDVGSGKTMIAEYALAVAAANNKLGVMMVPTEILAYQHYTVMSKLFYGMCCLYVGSMSEAEKAEVRRQIAADEVSIVIGTHALLNGNLELHRLGLAITDEQHRFGVMQRAKLANKSQDVDLLVMSATPIPRTLALLLYGNLDMATLSELPPGRIPIKTRFVSQDKRKDMYRYIAKKAAEGERAYVVCPLIEPTEGYEGLSASEVFSELSELLPKIRLKLLHGRMNEAEKMSAMQSFARGDTDILVATTVIEVGIDVPEACSIVIEGAERFGLSTLHQLRGRVGRGKKQSYCYLLSDIANPNSNARIAAMLNCSDGFEIAKQDLELRGAGDVLGIRQHGQGDAFSYMLHGGYDLVDKASQAAKEVLGMQQSEARALIKLAEERFCDSRDIVMN